MHTSRIILLNLLFGAISVLVFGQDKSKPATKVSLFFEKIYLHTDRELYAQGEDLWYKAYLVNAQTNQLLSSSNNLYVELISPMAEILSRQVIRLENGVGKGDFKLRDTLASGSYKLRAYTNWMRNFGDNFIFEKDITITGIDTKPTNQTASRTPIIRFFPEGGSMIEGVSSRVALKIVGPDGKGIVSKGAILSSKGDTATTFVSDATGMGSFFLKPLPGSKYTASIILGNKQVIKSELPAALLTGFALYVQEKDSLLNIMTFLNEQTFQQNQNTKLYLTVKHAGKTIIAAPVEITGTQIISRISKSDFPPGINSITLYDSKGRAQCERLIFITGKDKLAISITPDKVTYKPKEKVNLLVKATDVSGTPVKANFSLAVTDANAIPANAGNIQTYLLLQSDLKGRIENPEQYFDEKNANRQKQLDLLLLTQGWRDFIWKRIADSAIRVNRVLEQGITISGTAKDPGRTRPLIKGNISLRTPQSKGAKFFSTQTDSLGRYYFDNLQIYGTEQVLLASLNGKGEPYGVIRMDSLFSDILLVKKPISGYLNQDITAESQVLAKELIQRTKKLRLSDTIELAAVTIKSKARPIVLKSGAILTDFGYPEEKFKITEKDNKDYRTILHYLLTKSQYSVPNAGASNKLLFRGDKGAPIKPIINLNGSQLGVDIDETSTTEETTEDSETTSPALPATDDVDDDLATWTMDMVESIDIKKVMRTVAGSMPKVAYFVSINTKPGALDWKIRDKLLTTVNGYYQSRVFYSPIYEAPVNKSDMRSTIYWIPNVNTNAKGEATISYYNADPKDKIRIVAEGLSDKGMPITGTQYYEVK